MGGYRPAILILALQYRHRQPDVDDNDKREAVWDQLRGLNLTEGGGKRDEKKVVIAIQPKTFSKNLIILVASNPF